MRLIPATAIAIATLAVTPVAFANTPANGGTVGGSTIAIDNTAGDQLDPHVSGNLAAYSDAADPAQALIRYYDFLNPALPNASIPAGLDDVDTLSNVDGRHISFARYNTATGVRACMVYDVVSQATIQIGSGASVGATALGGDTVALVNGSPAEIMVGSIANPSGPLTNLSASPDNDVSPAVSPDGNLVVWASCVSFECTVMKSVRSGGAWSAPSVVRAAPASNPDTDGTSIVYDSGGDIYYQPAGGGAEVRLEIDGVERDPSISVGVIVFEGAPTPGTTADLFVYQIATNRVFRITDTPLIDETLNDVTVLDNGDVRVVWAADDDPYVAFARNIYARTFSLPPVAAYDFVGLFQPVYNLPTLNVASAGSAIPVKFSLSGDQGLAIFAAGYPASSPIRCDASDPGAVIEETVSAGTSSLRYDATADEYSYIWKTDKSWKGSCRMLVLRFNDASEHLAKFRFR
jgi:hypothetical protein